MHATLSSAPPASRGSDAPRAATAADIGALTGVLARAFDDDPMVCWFARQDARREARARRLFDWYLRDAIPHGLTMTTASHDGAAIWCPPGAWQMPLWRQAALLPTILSITGAANAPSRIAGVDLLSRKHPRRPHYYLAVVGVEPALQGQGLGSALPGPTWRTRSRRTCRCTSATASASPRRSRCRAGRGSGSCGASRRADGERR